MNNFKQKLTAYLKGRDFPATVLTAIIIAAVVFVNIIIYTLSTVFPLYLYSPTQDDFSISSSSEALFEKYIELGERVTVTFCSYEDQVNSHDTGKFVLETAKEFASKYPEFITLRFVNAITKLDSEGKSAAADLEAYGKDGENNINDTSVVFSTETNFRVLTDKVTGVGYADFYTLNNNKQITSYNGEEIFVSSILWTLSENHGVAYMTVGHGETADYTLYNILTAAGYEVKDINLRKNDIPEDAELVIISKPTSDFERGAEGSSLITEYDRLRAYQKRGGNFFITLSPLTKKLPVLESFVGDFGVSFYTVESGEKALIKDSQNGITTDGFTLVAEYADTDYAQAMKQIIGDRTGDTDASVIIRNVAALTLDPAKKAYPILSSSASSVCRAGGDTVDDAGNYTIAACAIADNDLSDSAKLFVMSEGMMTTGDAVVSDGYSNKDFLYSIFDVFYEKGDMPYGCNSVVYDTQILENLTMGSAKIYTALILTVPAVIAVVGAILIRRRKNR